MRSHFGVLVQGQLEPFTVSTIEKNKLSNPSLYNSNFTNKFFITRELPIVTQ